MSDVADRATIAANQIFTEDAGSFGVFRKPARLISSLVIGTKEDRVLARATDLIDTSTRSFSIGFGKDIPEPNFVQDHYKYRWHCNPFHTCESHLHWRVHCVDQASGSIITWDNIGGGACSDATRVTAENIASQPRIGHFSGASFEFLDWDKDGHDPNFNSAAKFWLNGLWWCWSFWSHA